METQAGYCFPRLRRKSFIIPSREKVHNMTMAKVQEVENRRGEREREKTTRSGQLIKHPSMNTNGTHPII